MFRTRVNDDLKIKSRILLYLFFLAAETCLFNNKNYSLRIFSHFPVKIANDSYSI